MGQNNAIGSRGQRYTIEQRFFSKINHGIRLPPGVCWPWTGAKTRLGYGNFWDGTYTPSNRPRMVEAHRWAFGYFVEDPDELHVLHECDTPACVNYLRCLFKGTAGDNARDRQAKGRTVMPDLHGFVRGKGTRFTVEQVLTIREGYTGARGEINRLAREHDCSHQTISDIIRGRSWHP